MSRDSKISASEASSSRSQEETSVPILMSKMSSESSLERKSEQETGALGEGRGALSSDEAETGLPKENLLGPESEGRASHCEGDPLAPQDAAHTFLPFPNTSSRSKIASIPRRIYAFLKGPRPPVPMPRIQPWFEQRQIRFTKWSVPLRKRPYAWITIVLLFYAIWITIFGILVWLDNYAAETSEGAPVQIGCTDSYWNKNDGCSVNGTSCTPFASPPRAFVCRGGCAGVTLLNSYPIANYTVNFVPLVVGGADALQTYRGDSFVCAAAIHAGYVSSTWGGCGQVELIGEYANFKASTSNGIVSYPFDSSFPRNYRFHPIQSSNCKDLQWVTVFPINFIFSVFVILGFNANGLLTWWTAIFLGFWHTFLVSGQRSNPPLVSDGVGSFLPTLFMAYALWRAAGRFALTPELMPLEKLWFLLPFWGGLLVTSYVPINRLGFGSVQPGQTAATAILIIVLVVIIIGQVWLMRRTGRLLYFLKFYILGLIILALSSQIPGLVLRIHHYFAALVLLPGTAFQTRYCLVYQGILLGMFLQGAARWGFDSILQTVAELIGDATIGTAIPSFTGYNATSGLVSWSMAGASATTSFSLLMNDVQRYSGNLTSFDVSSLLVGGLNYYFRVGTVSGDYTMGATLLANGTFIPPVPGST